MIEKDIQKYFIAELKKNNVPYFHIDDCVYMACRRKHVSALSIKYFPDILMAYNKKIWMVEFGIKGRHLERKEKQKDYMLNWHNYGDVGWRIIQSVDGADFFLKELGIKK